MKNISRDIELISLIQRARKNAHTQRLRVEAGCDVRVRPQFWEQVERDYLRELTELDKLSPKQPLYDLYNGIMNDYSIRRYSLGWDLIIKGIKKKLVVIPKTQIPFEDSLLIKALEVTDGDLHQHILTFGRELKINNETLREKKSI